MSLTKRLAEATAAGLLSPALYVSLMRNALDQLEVHRVPTLDDVANISLLGKGISAAMKRGAFTRETLAELEQMIAVAKSVVDTAIQGRGLRS